MITALLRRIDPVVVWGFRLHDVLSGFLARHLFGVKRTILVVAHLSLFGFFFPELRKDFGETSAHVLLVILFLSPLSKIFRTKLLLQMMSLRRELGILMAYLATVHGLGFMLDPQFVAAVSQMPSQPLFLVFGFSAYVLTLPLLLTSNNLAQKYLGGKKWKLLHRLVYLVFIFAVLHRMMVKGADTSAVAQSVILVSTYVLAKLLAWKNFLPPLVTGIEHVAGRYREYLQQQKAAVQPQNI